VPLLRLLSRVRKNSELHNHWQSNLPELREMITTIDSLRGQNSGGRVSGTRSSRVLSRIFKQLRNADRRISELDRQIHYSTVGLSWYCEANLGRLKSRRDKWDQRRKAIRLKRKGYTSSSFTSNVLAAGSDSTIVAD